MNRVTALTLCLLAFGCANASTPGYEFIPEMVDSIAYETFAPNPFMGDGKTLRAPAAGTIARGQSPFSYGPGPGEAARAGAELLNPVERTPEALARGENVFRVFCTLCHGQSGMGDGPMVAVFSKPPSLLAEKARSLPDGHIFHIITRGQNLMPSHASQITSEDRWKAVHYVRSLQAEGERR